MAGRKRGARSAQKQAAAAATNPPERHPVPALSLEQVIEAIGSLYADELKPYGRILRKRLAETVSEADVGIGQVRTACEECERRCLLTLSPEEGGDWSALLVNHQATFVDVYSPIDNYPSTLWSEAKTHFEGLGEEVMRLPGGRYSCAQALVALDLPFLREMSLGRICHIVQLAISQKKILGYLNGAVVPYGRSQSMVKDRCAVYQTACSSVVTDTAALPLAQWDAARRCLQEILLNAMQQEGGNGNVPLSNIKRLFRSQYKLELSETILGHSKLSELLQDHRFSDICSVQLQGHGYMVVPRSTLLSRGGDAGSLAGCSEAAAQAPSSWQWPSLSPTTLSKDGSVGKIVHNTFIHTAVPPPTPVAGAKQRSSSLPKDMGSDKSNWETACHALSFLYKPVDGGSDTTAETLERSTISIGEVADSFDGSSRESDCNGRWASPPPASPPPPGLDLADPLKVWLPGGGLSGGSLSTPLRPVEEEEPRAQLFLDRFEDSGVSLLSPTALSKDGAIGRLVQNTFIHTAVPPPTPTPGARRRAQSLPKDAGSEKSSWEATCHALGFLQREEAEPEPRAIFSLPRCATGSLTRCLEEAESDMPLAHIDCARVSPSPLTLTSPLASPAYLHLPPSPSPTYCRASTMTFSTFHTGGNVQLRLAELLQ